MTPKQNNVTIREQQAFNREHSEIVAETKDFMLVVGFLEVGQLAGHLGYKLVNKRTGVVEAEGVAEDTGIRAVHRFQRELDAALKDPEGVSTATGPLEFPLPPGFSVN